jgi:hypothetical protein
LSRFAVACQHAKPHPNAAVLHGQRAQVVQGGLLVAIDRCAVGKAAEDLVFPGLRKPGFGAGVCEFFELPAHAAHVGGRTHDDGRRGSQRFPAALGQVAFCINGQQHSTGAFGHGLRHALGMAVAGVVNNNN